MAYPIKYIETGTGNNHVYIDKEAQLSMAVNIIVTEQNEYHGCSGQSPGCVQDA